MDMQEVDAEVFKALSDANRLKILSMLSSGEICACRILEALDITQPTLSHHMKILSGPNGPSVTDTSVTFHGSDRPKWSPMNNSRSPMDLASLPQVK